MAITSTVLAVDDTKPSPREIAIAALGTLVRLTLGAVVIVLMLWLVPDAPDQRFLVPLGIAVVAIVGYVWFFRRQLKEVYRARFPTLRAVEALVLVAAMFLAVFTVFYVMLSLQDQEAFTEPLTSFNGFYFALTVLATVGFGDITPVTTPARALTMVQMALDLVFIAVVIRVVGATARKALAVRHRQPTPLAADPDGSGKDG